MALAVAVGPRTEALDLGGSSQLGRLVPRGRLGVEWNVWMGPWKDVQPRKDQAKEVEREKKVQ